VGPLDGDRAPTPDLPGSRQTPSPGRPRPRREGRSASPLGAQAVTRPPSRHTRPPIAASHGEHRTPSGAELPPVLQQPGHLRLHVVMTAALTVAAHNEFPAAGAHAETQSKNRSGGRRAAASAPSGPDDAAEIQPRRGRRPRSRVQHAARPPARPARRRGPWAADHGRTALANADTNERRLGQRRAREPARDSTPSPPSRPRGRARAGAPGPARVNLVRETRSVGPEDRRSFAERLRRAQRRIAGVDHAAARPSTEASLRGRAVRVRPAAGAPGEAASRLGPGFPVSTATAGRCPSAAPAA
jgi:hypothetical protein